MNDSTVECVWLYNRSNTTRAKRPYELESVQKSGDDDEQNHLTIPTLR
jgi:hypothetical protein